ncbi:MAG: phosphate/phosphite/phosphonate ABC transporter substrate-binding protein [Thiobacillus sp.]
MFRLSPLHGRLVLGALLCVPLITQAATLRMGVFAGSAGKDNQAELKAMFEPLADYISKSTGHTIRMEISQSFSNMERRLDAGRYAIFLGPPQFTADAVEAGFEPVAKWDKPIYGVIVVPTDSPHKSIADLKGLNIGIAGRETAAGPLCVDVIRKSGLRPDRDFAGLYEGRFQDVMVQQLANGSLDAICTGSGAWRMMNEQSPGKFRVIAESVRVPGFALSIDTGLSEADRKQLTNALVGIGKNPEGRRALAAISGSAAGAADTLPTNAREYTSSNQLIQENKRLYNTLIPAK